MNQCFGVTGKKRTSAWLFASFVEGYHCVCLIPPHSLNGDEGFSQDQVCKEGSRSKAQAEHSGLHSNESETKPNLHINASVIKEKEKKKTSERPHILSN